MKIITKINNWRTEICEIFFYYYYGLRPEIIAIFGLFGMIIGMFLGLLCIKNDFVVIGIAVLVSSICIFITSMKLLSDA
jgi:hypothetical protein